MMEKQSCSIPTAIYLPPLFLTSGISVNVQDLAPSCAGLLFGKDSVGFLCWRGGICRGDMVTSTNFEQEQLWAVSALCVHSLL